MNKNASKSFYKKLLSFSLVLLITASAVFCPGFSAWATQTDLPDDTADDIAEGEPEKTYDEAFFNLERLAGDVDGDKEITSFDARLALRLAVNLENFPEDCPAYLSADVTGDGKVTSDDARSILRAAVDLEWYEHEHTFVNAYCELCGKIDPRHYPIAFKNDFERNLYSTAHALYYKKSDELPANTGSLIESVYYRFGKWCAYYTIHHVFRPALKVSGYSDQKIDQIAPTSYDAKLLSSGLFVSPLVTLHVPSLLMDYYLTHPQYCKSYILYEFMDDVVNDKLYTRSDNADEYVPEVGDLLFMSNKDRTYVNGYPTVDHTAQIIQLYADGSFFCTEGSIINTDEEGQPPRVRERMYFYDKTTGTYKYRYNGTENQVIVLVCVKPDLSY